MSIKTPGVNVITRSAVNAQTPPTLTDTAFIVVETEQGRVDQPILCRSLSDYVSNFGARVAYSVAYDWLDAFFNEAGGGQVWVMRVVGPSATQDAVTFDDSDDAPSITINSIGPATSGLSASIVPGSADGSYQIVVTGLPGGDTLSSYDLFTVADAVQWGAVQRLITIVGAGTNAPADAAVTVLSGGSDDHASVTDTLRVDALALIPQGLGTGQVAIPGSTTETIQAGLLSHAATHNRFAILDTSDTNSASTLEGLAAACQADDTAWPAGGLEYGMMVSDWQVIPGLVPHTTRTVPPSAIVCALIARSDRSSGNPNLAAAGANGQVNYALGKTQADWTDDQTNSLVAAGVNPFRLVYNAERFYGFRTLASAITDPVFVMATASRLRMAICDQGFKIGESVLMDQIDGVGHEAAKYGGRISAMLLGYYNMGALFGATAADAYIVDVGPDVNTPDTISNRELHAAVGIVPAPFAETVFFELASYTVAQSV